MSLTYPPNIDVGVLWKLGEQRGHLDTHLRDLDRRRVPADHPERKRLTAMVVAHLEACRGYGVAFDGEPELAP
jgi:hypothetical protein